MIELRRLQSIEEFKKTIEIQKSAWGISDLEIEPYYLMGRVQKYGGLVQGLFVDNECVGFTYGIVGKWQGEYFFFSYMAAVMKEYQGRGFGFLLKKAQREEALKSGFDIIRWNFDPLESLNTYFNIHRLGVVSTEYERNIYGESGSGLHEGLPTDRLVATWHLKSDRVIRRIDGKQPRLIDNIGDEKIGNFSENIAYIEIPRDIRSLKKNDLKQAHQWRMKTRELFETGFAQGYSVEEVVFSKDQQRVFIKLTKGEM
jgi:predicted GNAT superfamily acetyltransferase